NLHKDLVQTILELIAIDMGRSFDGKSLLPLIRGERETNYTEFYINEAKWLRKHGWRAPDRKLIVELQPDIHFKLEVELDNLEDCPGENHSLADEELDVVAHLKQRMEAWIARRERETGLTNPIYTNLQWHGKDHGPFESSEQAYNELFIGSLTQARRLQQKE